MAYNFSFLQLAWLDALKSGRFKQGRECLTSLGDDGSPAHCCLGVACVIYDENSLGLGLKPLKVENQGYKRMYNGNKSYAPNPIVDSFKLKGEDGAFANYARINGWTYSSLASMNDACLSFAEIAAYIEANPENVFEQ